MSKKYCIIPIADKAAEVYAENAEDALVSFATDMDSDMHMYFRAVTEEEHLRICNERRIREHTAFVTDWMKNTILEDFEEIPAEEAQGCAELAFEIYCRGDGDTEYEAVEKAVEEWQKNA